MRDVQFRIRQNARPQSSAAKRDVRLQTVAAYGAFLLIASVIFGTLPFRPF